MSTHSSQQNFDIDLRKYLLVVKRRWIPAVGIFGLTTALSVGAALLSEPSYKATGKILVRPDRTTALAGLDVPGRPSIGEPEAIGLQSDPIATEVEAILSLEIAERTIQALSLQNDEGELITPEDFFKAFDASPIPGTDMIRLGYETDSPDLAADVVNTAIDVYRDKNIAAKRAEAIAAREFIANQLPNTEADLRQAEDALRQFKEDNQIVVLPEESVGVVTSIQQLESDIAQTRAELATTTARSLNLQQRLGMSPANALQAVALSQSPAIQETFAQIRDVQNQLDIARADYRSTHPTVASLERQEEELNQRLQGYVTDAIGSDAIPAQGLQMGVLEQDLTASLLQAEAERAGLVERIGELLQMRQDQSNRASIFPQLESNQRELERELTVAQSTYEALLQRLQEVQVTQNKTIDNVRVVSRAIAPEDPSSSKKLSVLLGMVVGATLGIIAAFLLDLLDQSVKTVSEAQELLELPILGVIPRLGGNVPFIVRPDDVNTKKAPHPYRLLQANLSFVSAETAHKVIVITSSVLGEGRTRVSANLASAVAETGTRVLLVDADLQQPNQHDVWSCQNKVGLVQVLRDDAKLSDAITNAAPNLDILPAGEQGSESSVIAKTPKLEDLIDKIARQYDIVLIDTPPLNQSADASTLGALADGTLIVTRPKFAKSDDVKAAKVLMNLSNQPALGLIVNGVEPGTSLMQYFASSSNRSASQIAAYDYSLVSQAERSFQENNSHVQNEPSLDTTAIK